MGKIDYIEAFRAAATQLNDRRTGREWAEANVPLDDAITWANAGYTPAEAAPLIAAGITPDMATTGEDIAVEVAGGPEAHAAQRIDELIHSGELADPARVRRLDLDE